MPILEAQAIGRPVLTSDLSPMREVAREGALKVDPLNVVSIRNGLKRLLAIPELRNELVKKGFENVKNYSATAIAAQYAEVYREVLDKP
jgi:glycosyltransferase involved in cell wall biosynthesis